MTDRPAVAVRRVRALASGIALATGLAPAVWFGWPGTLEAQSRLAQPSPGGTPTTLPIPAPEAGPLSPSPTASSTGPIRWHTLASGLDEAKRTGRPVLVDVVTDWCGWCKRMEKTTYASPSVREYIGRTFVAVKVDAEDDGARARYDGRTMTSREFADRFRVTGYPTTLFLARDGRLITMVPGYVNPERFLTVLHYIGDGHYRSRSFEAFAREANAGRR